MYELSAIHSDSIPLSGLSLSVNTGNILLSGDCVEVIKSESVPILDKVNDITFSYTNDNLFGYVSIDISNKDIVSVTESVYVQFFKLMRDHSFPFMWRAWNYIPRITKELHGLEFYKLFNIGRQNAFSVSKYPATQGAPAACGVGTDSKFITLCFLAGKVQPITIENPRQVSSYNYPRQYGISSPIFSRAVYIDDKIFISGTASITGYDTAHVNDISMQVVETLSNIDILFKHLPFPISHHNFVYKVYIRNSNQLSVIKDIVEKTIPTESVIYVKADLCRKDLDVEIEATSTTIMRLKKVHYG